MGRRRWISGAGDSRWSDARPVIDVDDHTAERLLDVTTHLVGRADAGAVLDLVIGACTDVVGAAAAGFLVREPLGGIRVVTASDERTAVVTVLETQYIDGPSPDCMASGTTAGSSNLAATRHAWPRFAPAAVAAGFHAAYAVPMRLDGEAVGGLTLLFTSHAVVDGPRLRICQVLADLAVLGLAQERDGPRTERVFAQTLKAANDRLSLGHAIGIVAGRLEVDIDTARAMIVHRARYTGSAIVEVALMIVDGMMSPHDLQASFPGRAGESSPDSR